jgi:A/G-specific adenine glycosylase
VGRYTAGAIRSIAFNEPAPIVDGNIERVFARLFAIRRPVKHAAVQRQLWELAGRWVGSRQASTHEPRVLNQALMELGATVCTPRRPGCDKCPLAGHCAAVQLGLVGTIPTRVAATLARHKRLLCLALRDDARRVWLVRREGGHPASLLPDGLWELPHADWPDDAASPANLLELGCKVLPIGKALERTHAIMDWRLTLCVLPAQAAGKPTWSHGPSGWFTPEQALRLPLASATRKLLEPILRARNAAHSRNSAALL